MSQHISIKDGYSCKAVNPNLKPSESDYYRRKSEGISWGDYLHKEWQDFESANPELPLTEHVEVGVRFEGRPAFKERKSENDVWDYCDIIGHDEYVCKTGYTQQKFIEPVIHPTQTVGEGEKEKDGWISVEDRLPEKEIDVLVYLQLGEFSKIEKDSFRFLTDDGEQKNWFHYHNATHWMPLPSPPKL
jgi:uncharacterized protein DUF551